MLCTSQNHTITTLLPWDGLLNLSDSQILTWIGINIPKTLHTVSMKIKCDWFIRKIIKSHTQVIYHSPITASQKTVVIMII